MKESVYKKEDTKKKILEEALKLFSERGYDAVSVGEIAKEVGIKAPSLYSHYPSKQAIFDAIVCETSEKYKEYTNGIAIHMHNAKMDVSLFSGVSENLLIEKIHQIFKYSLHDVTISRFRKMMTMEQFRTPELSKLYSDRYNDRIVLYHAKIFEALIKNGEIKNENPETLAMMYVTPIINLLCICDRQPEREEECIKNLDEHVKLFYRTYNTLADK